MPKTHKYATNSLEQPLYVFMNVNLLYNQCFTTRQRHIQKHLR